MPVLCLILLLAGPDDAVPKPEEVANRFRKVQTANRRSLRGARWSQRVDVYLERERRARRTFLLEFDGEGALKASLQSSALLKPRRPKFRVVETAADRKRDKELIAWVEQAEAALRAYVYHDPDRLAAALGRAKLEKGTGSLQGALVATADGFLEANDLVRVWIDPKTWSPLRLEYRARVQGEAVRGWVNYERLAKPDAYYPRRTELTAPGRKIRLRLDNRDLVVPKPEAKTKDG